jgi:hypothetical protein
LQILLRAPAALQEQDSPILSSLTGDGELGIETMVKWWTAIGMREG